MVYGIATKCYHYHKERNIIMDNENNIDINQYIEYDEDTHRVYFKSEQFLQDAKEYLQNDNPEYEIVEVM
tara:strand:+ start:1663 stop:1872 length:210 start_codon:yes stop_codon:yes gene_type:complete